MMKRLLSVLVFFAFIALMFNMNVGVRDMASGDEGIDPTRMDFEVNTFHNDNQASTITYPTSGSKSDLKFELPTACLIQSATMDVEGRPYYTAASTYTAKDYSDTTNNYAYWGRNSTSDLPPKSNPNSLTGWSSQFTSGQYNNIATNNSAEVYHEASSTYSGNPAYHLFKVYVDKSQTSHMYIKWRGTAQHSSYTYYQQTAYMGIYDHHIRQWQQATSVKCSTNHGTTYQMTLDVDRRALYDNYLYFVVWGEETQYGYGYYQSITTRYVEVKAFDRQLNFPTNPGIDLNDDGSTEWTATGSLSSKATFSGMNFQNTLQTLVNIADGKDIKEIPIKVSSQSMGVLFLSNISIKYKFNQDPVINTIPSPIQILEDVGKYNTGIKLDGFITDDMSYDLLTLDAVGYETEDMGITFNADKELIVEPADDFYGEVSFKVAATDWGLNDVDEDGKGDDVTIYSNDIFIQVLPTDDIPEILDINKKEPILIATYDSYSKSKLEYTGTDAINEDSTFVMYLNATDIDGDEITFTSNTTRGKRFSWDRTDEMGYEWMLMFKPDHRDIGKQIFELKLTEDNNSVSPLKEAVLELTIEVLNVNDNPIIQYFDVQGDGKYTHSGSTTEITVLEDAWANITMKIYDQDGDYVVLDSNFTNIRFDLDTIDGKINFLPIQEDVGTHHIGFTLEDDNGGFTEATLKLTVENVNDKPINNGFTVTPDKSNPLNVSCTANEGTDEDGDTLIYKWNFGDKVTAQGIQVYHDYWKPEETTTATITLIVGDGKADSETVSQDYTITVGEGGVIVVEGPTYEEPTDDWKENAENKDDTDSDGIPNWWEEINELDMNDPDDASDEYKEEYRAELNNYEAWKRDQEQPEEEEEEEEEEGEKSNTGVIVVVLVAVFLVMIAIVAIVLLLVGKKKKAVKEEEQKKSEKEAKKEAAYSDLYGTTPPQQQDQTQYLPPGQQ